MKWCDIDPRQNPCATFEQWQEYVKRCREVYNLDRSTLGGYLMYDGERYAIRVTRIAVARVDMDYADLRTGEQRSVQVTWGGIEYLDS